MKKSRHEALLAGERKYRTGKPCKHGHLSLRWTIDGACVECRAKYTAEHLKQEREAFRELLKAK